MQPFRVTLQVREDAKPPFCKARSVPFATKEAIEAELDRLESCGILEKVDYSLWAALIVAVTKKDGKIRICGDYKVTVNQSLEVDQYPLPKPDELFALLAGGQKFTKLDLSQAYQQLLLDAAVRHNQYSSRTLPIHASTIWNSLSPSNISENDGYHPTRATKRLLLYR